METEKINPVRKREQWRKEVEREREGGRGRRARREGERGRKEREERRKEKGEESQMF